MARLPRLPDLLTTANLACGVGSILLASQGQLTIACWLVFAGAVFDVFDGLAARALGGGSPLGTQLDSLADMVTFGAAPATIVYIYGMLGSSGWTIYPPLAVMSEEMRGGPEPAHWPLLTAALVLVVASGWRLAKFNIDTRQTGGFLGLPTPANGLFWVSLVLGMEGTRPTSFYLSDIVVGRGEVPESTDPVGLSDIFSHLDNPFVILVLSVAMAILMLSELPLPSLKFKHFHWKGNEVIYLLGGIGLVLVLLYGILAVPLILVLYLLSPLWGKLFPKT